MVKKKKYAIDDDFKKWENFHPPLSQFALFFTRNIMKLCFYLDKTNSVYEVKRDKVFYNKKDKVNIIIYSPTDLKKNAPCLIYYHGGGFVMPASPYHYSNAKQYATKGSCKVIFVDYPLSPKYKYPIPVQASYAVYKWVIDNAKELSIDKNKIIVAGDSAGGNLASVVTLMAHDKKEIMPCAQMLMYPATGAEIETDSMAAYTDTPMCNSKDYIKYRKYYFKTEADKNDRYVSPIRAECYNIYPTTYIETAEFDCLRDEAIMFAQLLKDAGVKTIVNNTKGTIHGYDIVEDSDITKENINKRVEFLKECFKK